MIGWLRVNGLAWLTGLVLIAVLMVSVATSVSVLVLATALLLCGVCVVVIFGISLTSVGVACVVALSFTASWDEAAVGGIKPRLIFLGLGVIALYVGYGLKHPPHIPWWLHAYGLTAVFVTVMQTFFPIDPVYLATRYDTSTAGQSLGTRPGALPSLLSLLVNNYAVPLAVVMACMCVPRALRWILGAYVTGVGVSSFAGYLGYEGHQFLVKLFTTPPPPHFRANGFTSHSLHLATSIVMAIPLACWMAVQPGRMMKWSGRLSLVAMVLGLYSSGSRGGNVAGLVGLALSIFLLPAIRRRIHLVLALAAVALAGVTVWLPSVVQSVLDTTRLSGGATAAASDVGRGQVFDQGMHDLAQSPVFGIGVRYIAEAHVLFVGVAASGGVLLFGAWMLFNAGSLIAVWRSMSVDRALGGALLATLLGSLVYWTVADDFQVASVLIVYGFVLALLAVGSRGVPAQDVATSIGSASPGGLQGEPAGLASRGLPADRRIGSRHAHLGGVG